MLRLRTLLPEKRIITVVGGPGFEYFNAFTGLNYPPENPARANAPREAGNWRIEVSPADNSTEDVFLNTFQFSRGLEVRTLAADSPGWTGVEIPGHVLVFSREVDGSASLPLRYRADASGPSGHLVFNLPPRAELIIRVNGKTIPARATPSGILKFEDRGQTPATGFKVIEISSKRP
jgi:hypothetical protein